MISIIICTAQLDKLVNIENNISSTIGVEFELVIIDNSKSEYDIFQAYNIAVKRSKFPTLCFMHDDIVYHSKDWGKEVENYFKLPSTGMIGVGGTRFLSSIPTIWWAGGHKYHNVKSGTVCHNSIDTNRDDLSESNYNIINPENSTHTKVVVLDGLWFCIRKEIFLHAKFDENYYSGFHFYDLDISMQINKLKYNIFCVFNIKLEHISASKLNKGWVENCIKFYSKWGTVFPISTVNIPFKQFVYINFNSLRISCNIFKCNDVKFPLFYLLRNGHFSKLLKYFISSLKSQKTE